MAEVERFIRIHNLVPAPGKADPEWRTLPNGNRVRVWELGNVDALGDEAAEDTNPRRFIFHIAFMDPSRGAAASLTWGRVSRC